jgi:hypothetical protein
MKLEDRIKNHPVVWLLSLLFAGFLAGIGAFQFVITYSGQVLVSKAVAEQSQCTSSTNRELPKLAGRYEVLRCNKVPGLATVEQQGSSLTLMNEEPSPLSSPGVFVFEADKVSAVKWNALGTISRADDSIVWENGTVWRKSKR